MLSGRCQPNAPVPASRRLLAHEEPALADAASVTLAVAQFDTRRLRMIKVAVRIEVLKTQLRLHAKSDAGSGDLHTAADAYAPSKPMGHGARCPDFA